MNTTKAGEIFLQETHGGVVQDKQPQVWLTADSPQPATASTSAVGSKRGSATATTPAVDRVSHGSEKRQTEQVTGRVRPHIKTALLMVAKQNGWKGESKAVATACEAYLEHDLGEKFGIRLAAQMTEALKKEMQGHNNRCANLALKAFYAAEQARILNIHALQFILGVTEDVDQLPLILEASQKEAWKNLKRHIGDDATDR